MWMCSHFLSLSSLLHPLPLYILALIPFSLVSIVTLSFFSTFHPLSPLIFTHTPFPFFPFLSPFLIMKFRVSPSFLLIFILIFFVNGYQGRVDCQRPCKRTVQLHMNLVNQARLAKLPATGSSLIGWHALCITSLMWPTKNWHFLWYIHTCFSRQLFNIFARDFYWDKVPRTWEWACSLYIFVSSTERILHSNYMAISRQASEKRYVQTIYKQQFLLILKSTELKPSRTNVDAAEIRNFKLFSYVVWKIQ